MWIFKTKVFSKWAAKEGLTDSVLLDALKEVERGLIDAPLGGQLFKKRVALVGRGKRGGGRTIIAYRADDRAFFIYGYSKSAQESISHDELLALRRLSSEYLDLSVEALQLALDGGALIEVEENG